MKHIFQHCCYDKSALLSNCNKLSTFMRRLSKQSEEKRGLGWTSDEYKGMGFESLIEVLIKCSPIDKRINIINYRPHSNRTDGPDMGIDGYGLSHDGKPHTVQIKFRSNVTEDLTTKDMISNFVANTVANPKFQQADMTVFTTAKGLNKKISDIMYHNRVRTFGYEELSKLLDNNDAFWDRYRSEIGIQSI